MKTIKYSGRDFEITRHNANVIQVVLLEKPDGPKQARKPGDGAVGWYGLQAPGEDGTGIRKDSPFVMTIEASAVTPTGIVREDPAFPADDLRQVGYVCQRDKRRDPDYNWFHANPAADGFGQPPLVTTKKACFELCDWLLSVPTDASRQAYRNGMTDWLGE